MYTHMQLTLQEMRRKGKTRTTGYRDKQVAITTPRDERTSEPKDVQTHSETDDALSLRPLMIWTTLFGERVTTPLSSFFVQYFASWYRNIVIAGHQQYYMNCYSVLQCTLEQQGDCIRSYNCQSRVSCANQLAKNCTRGSMKGKGGPCYTPFTRE